MSEFRHTARAIVIRDGRLLLMERWRGGLHYFSIPGGGIEAGETPEMAVVRELFEETSIDVSVKRLLYEMRAGRTIHYIFLCDYLRGRPKLQPDSEEAKLTELTDNRFKPVWQPLEKLPVLPLMYWEPLKRHLLKDIQSEFAGGVMIIRTNDN